MKKFLIKWHYSILVFGGFLSGVTFGSFYTFPIILGLLFLHVCIVDWKTPGHKIGSKEEHHTNTMIGTLKERGNEEGE